MKILKFTVLLALLVPTAGFVYAQKYTVNPVQKAQAQKTAELGVPVSELASNAPDQYTVKPKDTLWDISGVFLKSPWRWPDLWGMNLEEIKNPHLIYPKQVLYLIKKDGRALLSLSKDGGKTPAALPELKLSPKVKFSNLPDNTIPTLDNNLIEPFLASPVVLDDASIQIAPRVVSAQEGRVLLSRGDRVYARSGNGQELKDPAGERIIYRVYRNPVPIKDPNTQQVLAYEAQHVGSLRLIRGESMAKAIDSKPEDPAQIVPATLDVVSAKEEIYAGDRLVADIPFEIRSYVPKAPSNPVLARVASLHGNAFAVAGQRQVLAINRGNRDGLAVGDVLAVLNNGETVIDKTAEKPQAIRLPTERNGIAMVFRVFEKVSYVLVLESQRPIAIGDYLVNPR